MQERSRDFSLRIGQRKRGMHSQMTDLTLYLLRHGEATANVDRVFAAKKVDPPLSQAGIEQALRQAGWLRTAGVDVIHSSPLIRARKTAEIIGAECKLDVKFFDALREVDVGVLDGQSMDDASNIAIYERVVKQWEAGLASVGFPEGETLSDIENRFKAYIDGLDDGEERSVLTVGHCLLFMAVIWLFCENHGPSFEHGHMSRGHVPIMSMADKRFRLVKFNLSPEMI